MWYSGLIYHDEIMYSYDAKVYDLPSRYGINSSRVSKLTVTELLTEKLILDYDRCWVEPKCLPKPGTLQEAILNKILEIFHERIG